MDERIGANITRFRGDLSQRELAARMRERGWKWSHLTVGSVERGERPLRLSEAEDLREILGAEYWALVSLNEAEVSLRVAARALDRAQDMLETSVRQFIDAQLSLKVAAAAVDSDLLDWAMRERLALTVDDVSQVVAGETIAYIEGRADLSRNVKERS